MAQVNIDEVIIRRHLQGKAIPTAGRFVKGDIIWNLEPAIGGPVGWICLTSGTPGVWRSWGVIA